MATLCLVVTWLLLIVFLSIMVAREHGVSRAAVSSFAGDTTPGVPPTCTRSCLGLISLAMDLFLPFCIVYAI